MSGHPALVAGVPEVVVCVPPDRSTGRIAPITLAAAAVAHPGDVPQQVARDAVATAETVVPGVGPSGAALVEETERVAAWLEQPGVRLIEIEGDWSWPVHVGLAEGQLGELALGERRAG